MFRGLFKTQTPNEKAQTKNNENKRKNALKQALYNAGAAYRETNTYPELLTRGRGKIRGFSKNNNYSEIMTKLIQTKLKKKEAFNRLELTNGEKNNLKNIIPKKNKNKNLTYQNLNSILKNRLNIKYDNYSNSYSKLVNRLLLKRQIEKRKEICNKHSYAWCK